MKTTKSLFVCLLVLFMALTLVGCGDKHDKSYVEDKANYTLHYSANSLPTSWNNHTYQSNDATYIIDYTEDGLYTFDYNDAKDGYQIVPSMAAEMPKDVTSQYVGKYGITEESKNQVYEIALKSWLKYDNGDSITANDFIKSAQLLLDGNAANYRADNFYAGNLCIYNAEMYFKGGQTTNEDATAGEGLCAYKDVVWEMGTDGSQLPDEIKNELIFDMDNCYIVSQGYGMKYYVAYTGVAQEVWEAMNGKTLAEILANEEWTAALNAALYDFWCTDEGEQYGFFTYKKTWDKMDWSEVGYFAKDDHTLVLVLTKPLSGFYLKYSLCSNLNLVHNVTYENCISNEGGVYSNSYGTSVESYVGYGPYKLTQYVDSSEFKLERNPFWHGYYEEEKKGQYQTTAISYKQVSEASTRLEMFLKGELDSYGLQAEDMADYQSSDFCYYTEGDSTWFIALNPDLDGLASAEETATPVTAGNKVVKRIIAIKEFREALSFSVDRAYYELTLDPTGSPAKALYGNMIISDPDNGTAYRTTDQAKQVIVDFWGLSDAYGEGKEYATIDDAIASITGYDLAGAKELFNAAYDEAVKEGYIPEGDAWEIQILIGQPGSGSSKYYNNGYELLKKVWTEAVEGTKLEGHLQFSQSQPLGSSNFSSYLKNNSIDLLFGVGWTGSALDPYSLIEAYVAPNYQYDPAIDYSLIKTTVVIDGKEEVASAYDWYLALSGEEITTEAGTKVIAGSDADGTLRLNILAAIEGVVLQQYTMIPVGLDASASLKGMRIKYYTEEYVYGMGRGGVQYMTFAMTDEEWASYVSSQGGTVDYR